MARRRTQLRDRMPDRQLPADAPMAGAGVLAKVHVSHHARQRYHERVTPHLSRSDAVRQLRDHLGRASVTLGREHAWIRAARRGAENEFFLVIDGVVALPVQRCTREQLAQHGRPFVATTVLGQLLDLRSLSLPEIKRLLYVRSADTRALGLQGPRAGAAVLDRFPDSSAEISTDPPAWLPETAPAGTLAWLVTGKLCMAVGHSQTTMPLQSLGLFTMPKGPAHTPPQT